MTGLSALVSGILAGAPPGPLGIAVSGGGDSVALLLAARDWGQRPLHAVTVDHGLRPESADEAAGVARLCAGLGIGHDVLRWDGAVQGNLQASARAARRGLIADWARARGIAAVALGHTADDQAETFLMRLARGSGVDGLSAMAPVSQGAGLVWLRPLLAARRAALRQALRDAGVPWVEDPGNDDPAFDRIRLRQAMPALAALGLTVERLCGTAERLATAREALGIMAVSAAGQAARATGAGEVLLAPGWANLPVEVRHRLLAGALMWVASEEYRPRHAMLAELDAAIRAGLPGGARTLAGCVIRGTGDGVAVRREPARVRPPVPAGQVWDGRWRTTAAAGLTVGALGEDGLAAFPDWRAAGLPREVLLATPAYRDGARIVAHPWLLPQESLKADLNSAVQGYEAMLKRR